ncbi:hypothetical protein GQ457_18G009090 [Hibiscus cannabinus]
MARLALCLVRAACLVGCLPIDGVLAGAVDTPRSCGLCSCPHTPWPNFLCATTGPLASLCVAALVVGFIFFRPITNVVAADGCLACFQSFHFDWCASMPTLCSLCLRPTLVLADVFVSGISLVVGPFQWPFFRLEFVSNHTDWSMEQPFSVALAAAEGAPLLATFALVIFGMFAPCTRAVSLACIPHCGCLTIVSEALPSRPGLTSGSVSGLPLSPALPHGCPWNGLISRPGLMIGYLLVLQVTFIGPNSATLVSFNSSPSFVIFFYYILLMVDSLLAKLGDLTFTTEEQDAIVVAPDSVAIPAEDFACSLVGKVDDKILTISEINPNFFLISFASPANRANVLKRGPWDFQKYWFALEQADPNRTIHDYSFLHMCIWVRIHNIPLSLMTAALARVLRASIGKVIMTDTRLEDGNMGEFMRVCVLIDTSKPLRRCVVLSRPDAKASMCLLQYELLPLFCHGCGLIGQPVLACPTTPKVEGQKFQYGAWLRAPLPKRSATRPRG